MSNLMPRSSHSRPFSANRTHLGTTPKRVRDGRKYPEMTQRGYYSDIVGPHAEQDLGVSSFTGPIHL